MKKKSVNLKDRIIEITQSEYQRKQKGKKKKKNSLKDLPDQKKGFKVYVKRVRLKTYWEK